MRTVPAQAAFVHLSKPVRATANCRLEAMLEKPEIDENTVAAYVQDAYGLEVAGITFLPLGADSNTAVYRVVDRTGRPFFLKLRSGDFAESSVTLPRFLRDHGLSQIIAPLADQAGRLWNDLGDFKLILYPFVEGRDGYKVSLTEPQWIEVGAALRRLHTLALPPELSRSIRREAYAPVWRDRVKGWLARVEVETFDEPVAAETATLLRAQRDAIGDLVGRAERYARALRRRSLLPVVCHGDLHAGNFHLTGDGRLYIVDWDEPVLAPKERDLMFAGAGLMGGWRSPEEEEALFYQGYGPAEADRQALAYFRYERIIADIAVYSEELLGTTDGGDDRAQSLRYLRSNFEPGGTIEIARESDRSSPGRK